VAFAHELETVLDLLRDGRLALAPPVGDLLLRSTDVLSDLVAATRDGIAKPAGFEDELITALRTIASDGGSAIPAIRPKAMEQATATPGLTQYRVLFVPRSGLFKSANEPLLIIRQLMRVGRVRVEADLSRLPALGDLDPEEAYLAWTLLIETTEATAAIEQAFEFVEDDCDLTIEILDDALGSEVAADTQAPIAATAAGPSTAPPPSPSIRVDVDKVDRLVNLVGNWLSIRQCSRNLACVCRRRCAADC
jgi:two-component system chemotaxis sensor kinase CheA